jgi:hypothetical protein
MTAVPRPRELRREDPLSAPPASPAASGIPALATKTTTTPAFGPAAPTEPQWREWKGKTVMRSFRLPAELLAELTEAAARTRVPAGHLLTAALTAGLDVPDAEKVARADRAQEALRIGRRNNSPQENR